VKTRLLPAAYAAQTLSTAARAASLLTVIA